MSNGFDWAIIEDGGVSDRFATREEAEAALPDYFPEARVEFSPEPEVFQ